jgi:hypothetical protein
MEQSLSWEANTCSASQKITRFLYNNVVHYCVNKRSPSARVMSLMNPVEHPHHISLTSI